MILRQRKKMAKLQFKAIGKDRRTHRFLECNAGVQILNNGTVQIVLPIKLAKKLGFNQARYKSDTGNQI